MTTEQTWKWNGSSIAQTASSGAVWTVADVELPDLRTVSGTKVIESHDAAIEIGSASARPDDVVRIVVEADTSAVTGSTAERRNMDAWEEFGAFFDPFGGVVKLESTRKDGAAADVVRHLWVECLGASPYRAMPARPKGLDASAAYPGAGDESYIIYVVEARLMFPLWQDATLLDDDTAPATAKLDIDSGTPDTITVNNPGVRWCGVRALVDNTSGSVTGWRITNTTNGDVLQVNDAGFADDDYYDWFATDPRQRSYTSGHSPQVGSGKLRLEKGNNALEGVRASGSGTLDLLLSWPKLSFTP